MKLAPKLKSAMPSLTGEEIMTQVTALSASRSPSYEPVGSVDNNQVVFCRDTIRRETHEIQELNTRVALIKTCRGMNSGFIDFSLQQGCQGIVLEAMGRGNIPLEMVPGVRRAIVSRVPVVIVSRCYEGRALDT